MTFESQTRPDDPPSLNGLRNDLLNFVSGRVPEGESVTVETDLLETELLDSLLIMDLVAHIESAYGVKLENADIAPRHFRTVDSLARLVAERRL
ncbi:MAG: phosphopantetheine-binding protein [Planctomycetota bacterium]|nr:acyl carrier protein [Planctomycetaceae bacterium]MDQ3332289.1 phosphopantetheine-binding protein [Planctomycetota bacterium]